MAQEEEIRFKGLRVIADELSFSASRVSSESKVIQLYYDLKHIFRGTSTDPLVVLSRMKSWLHKYNTQLQCVPASMLNDDLKLDRLMHYVQFHAYPERKLTPKP